MIKKIKMILMVVAIIGISVWIYENFSALYSYVEAYEMGEIITIEVVEDQKTDYEILEDESFKKIDQEKLEVLREYMKRNNLALRCGTYEINESYTYEELIEVFEFQENQVTD